MSRENQYLMITYFLPRPIIPYKTPQPNMRPQAKMLPNPGHRMTGKRARLKRKKENLNMFCINKCKVYEYLTRNIMQRDSTMAFHQFCLKLFVHDQ